MPRGEWVERNIFRRGETYYIQYTDATGRQRVKSTKSREIKHARALLAKHKAEAFEGREFPAKGTLRLSMARLRDYATEHMNEHRRSGDHVRHLKAAARFFGENRTAISLTFEDLQEYRKHLATRKNGKPRSTSTVNGYLVDLLTAFNLAAKARLIPHNPVHGFKLKDPKNERDRTASPDEYERLMAAVRDDDLRLAIVIGYHTPMRLGEIMQLERGRVFLNRRFIALGEHQTKNSDGRLVPISKPVLVELERFLKAYPDRRGRLLRPDVPSVRLAMQQISKLFGETADRAECGDLTFHDLKHTIDSRQ